MNTSAFEDLLLNAVEHPDKAVCCELTKQLEAMANPMPEDVSGKLELLWEGWSGALTDVQAAFCLTAASRGASPWRRTTRSRVSFWTVSVRI